MNTKSVLSPATSVNDTPPEYTIECRRRYIRTTLRALSPAAKTLWLTLGTYGRRDGRGRTVCYPGMPALEQATGFARRTISRAVRELIAIKWIAVRRTRNSNLYHLLDQAPDAARMFRAYLFEPR